MTLINRVFQHIPHFCEPCFTIKHGSPTALSEVHLKLHAKRSGNAVIESAQLRAGDVVLHIARVEVIGDVKYLHSDSRRVLFASERHGEAFRHLHIEREEIREAPRRVALANKILVLIQQRVWKSRVPVKGRRGGKFERQSDITPGEKSVRRIERQTRVFIGANHRIA